MDPVMVKNAREALVRVLDLHKGERFLVVTDDATLEVGEAFEAAASEIGADATKYVLPQDARPLSTVPEDLASKIPGTDVAVTCFEGTAEETPFRIELIRSITATARRLGHAPGITAAMLREGPMAVDYAKMAAKAAALIERFAGAVTIHVTAPGGTDIFLNVANRPFATDTVINDGGWGNLPAGEIWCAPVEHAAHGILVCDGSIGDLGKVPSPVTLKVDGGRVTAIECSDTGFSARIEKALAVDPEARVIGEFGIGLNPGAALTGNLLEDEKAGGTAHIAFGNNEDMGGGMNRSATHRDFLFKDPTVTVSFADGRIEKILDAGKVTDKVMDSRGAGAYKHVMAAVDFSSASIRALKAAHSLASWSGARLTVCHVIPGNTPISPLFPQYSAFQDPSGMTELKDEVAMRLYDLVQSATGRGREHFSIRVDTGQPSSEIVRTAEKIDADMVVVSSHGLSKLTRMVMGSVAASVARHAHCDVLVVR